jgi:hypothetical protein
MESSFSVKFDRGLILVDLSPSFPVEIAFASQPEGGLVEVARFTTSEKAGATRLPWKVVKEAKKAAASGSLTLPLG